MRIPSRSQLFGQTIQVVYKSNLEGKYGNVGEARYTENKIALMPNMPGSYERPSDQREQVFCHELVHHILNQMYETELQKKERFVDIFGSLLHQFFKTAEYDEAEITCHL